MKTRCLLGALLLSVCSLVGCSDDDNNGSGSVTPFDLGKTYYETRLARGETQIYITNGSGDVSLTIADENVLQATYEEILGADEVKGTVHLVGKRKGTTALTLTDNVTGDKETVEVKVTDCYIAYEIIASNHPALRQDMTLYLVNNEARDCYFYSEDQPDSTPVATGTYEFLVKQTEEGTAPYLHLSYPSGADGSFAESVSGHDFRIEMQGADATSSASLTIIETYLGVDWEALIADAQAKSLPPARYTLLLTVPDTDYVITGILSTMAMPENVLD